MPLDPICSIPRSVRICIPTIPPGLRTSFSGVISGDTAPLDIIAEKAKNCDILLHEVEYAAGIAAREPKWQKYHREVHTLSTDLAEVAKKAQPKLLVTYHRIYHMNIQDNAIDVEAETRRRSDLILQEIRDAGYTGKVVNGEDLDVFNA